MIPVSVDLMGEQKTILAYLSLRQFWLIIPMLAVSFVQIIFINYPFISGWFEFIVKVLVFIGINGTTICLAFIKIEKYDVFLSTYIVNRINFLRSQKIYTN